jgi:hypothetical protein
LSGVSVRSSWLHETIVGSSAPPPPTRVGTQDGEALQHKLAHAMPPDAEPAVRGRPAAAVARLRGVHHLIPEKVLDIR